MKEITLENPVSKVTVFYIEEYDSVILRQEVRHGFTDILMTISQLLELVRKLAEVKA